MKIGEVIEFFPCIDEAVKNEEVDLLFTQNPTLRGIVVVREGRPIGQITRTHFYQKIGTRYGYNLFMGRQSQLIKKNHPLIVEKNIPITEVSTLSMQRPEEDLYDDVIVTKNGMFFGVVSVRNLLLNLVETQVAIASFLNPLSHLPGNKLIDDKLKETLLLPKYSLMYVDLDHFKIYNDTYGFTRGDKILLYVTDILKKNIAGEDEFLGHVGGDDYVAVFPHYAVEPICQTIIGEFDAKIKDFYEMDDLQNLQVANRRGELQPFTCTSVSIAVITTEYQQFETVEQLTDAVTRIKKACKKIDGSCYLINEKQTHLVH